MYVLSISALTLFDLHYELSTVHDAWPMIKPLQTVMIMHELKNELKTSVRCASRYHSCGHDMRIDMAIGGVAYTGRKVRE